MVACTIPDSIQRKQGEMFTATFHPRPECEGYSHVSAAAAETDLSRTPENFHPPLSSLPPQCVLLATNTFRIQSDQRSQITTSKKLWQRGQRSKWSPMEIGRALAGSHLPDVVSSSSDLRAAVHCSPANMSESAWLPHQMPHASGERKEHKLTWHQTQIAVRTTTTKPKGSGRKKK